MTDILDRTLDDGSPAEADASPLEPITTWPTAPGRPGRDDTWVWVKRIAALLVVGGAVIYTLAQLHPGLIFKDTTPAGGDMGAHVWGPAYLRDHILPHWRLTGWAPDWYAGFPMYQFYMLPPALAVVLINLVLPYGVALKLVSVAGIATFPVCCWAFGKLSGLKFPTPELFAVAGVFFLFDEHFTIYGGNIASTMAGEFSFSIALSLSMLYLGVFAYGMRTGKHRALAAGLFALCALCHVIVAFFAIIGTVVLFLLWADRKRTRYVVSVGLVGGLLTAFWFLPFERGGPFMTDMFYERLTDYVDNLFPQDTWIMVAMLVLAGIGLIGAVVRGYRAGTFLGIMNIGYSIWFVLWPQSHLWNARLLPFVYLTRYLLVAMGVVEVASLLVYAASVQAREALTKTADPERSARLGRRLQPGHQTLVRRRVQLATLAVGVVFSVLALGLHLQNLPFFSQYYDQGRQEWVYGAGPLTVKSQPAFVDDWAKWNYDGYENKPAYGEYYGIVNTMKTLGQDRGCGRALWENNNSEDAYGTPMALMLLPFWTDGCIGSMEGLYFEASGTTPYHFLTTSAMSAHSSNPVRRLQYEDGQVDKGVQYMESLGVRYYLAFSPSVIEQADNNPDLTPVGQSGPWKVYEVGNHDLVTPLTTTPVVVNDLGKSRDRWLELGTSWFQNQSSWSAIPAADGPADWQRISLTREGVTDDRTLATVAPAEPINATPLPPVAVTNVQQGDDSISFTVDQVGVPVLVKESYFPNWKVDGADGPYRVAPNLMVVIPTANNVTMHYGYVSTDYLGYFLSLLGIVGLVVLWRKGPIKYDLPRSKRDRTPMPTPVPDALLAWAPPPIEISDETLLLDWDEEYVDAPEPTANGSPPGPASPETEVAVDAQPAAGSAVATNRSTDGAPGEADVDPWTTTLRPHGQ